METINLSDALAGKHDNELNRIAAELAGWRQSTSFRNFWYPPNKDRGVIESDLPDFVSSLDAVAQIEVGMSEEQLQIMNEILCDVVPANVRLWRATARQRVVALVLMLRPGVIV